MNEIRDSKSRMLLEALPFEIQLREPNKESMRAVSIFARLTGDFASLSLTDLKLMALTYELEVEELGDAHIRAEPPRLQTLKAKAPETKKLDGKIKAALNNDAAFYPGSSDVTGFDNCSGETQHSHANQAATSTDAAAVSASVSVEMAHVETFASVPTNAVVDPAPVAATKGQETIVSLAKELKASVKFEDVVEDTAEVDYSIENDFPSLEGAPSTAHGCTDVKVSSTASSAPSVFSWSNVASSPVVPGQFSAPVSKNSKNIFMGGTSAVPSAIHGVAESNGVDVFASTLPDDEAGAEELSSTRDLTSKIMSGQNGRSIAAEDFNDDGMGWISPDNIKKCKASGDGMLGSGLSMRKKGSGKDAPTQPTKVACLTNDFSMQNSLIQMNLHIMSLDGMIVRRVKQFVLRCNGCYTVQYDTDKLFCSKCGGNYLSRVSASVDSRTGQMKLHLRKDYKHDLRGKQYSLPAPGKQGKYDGELLLREDQLLGGAWRQKVVKVNKDVRSAFGDDIISDLGMHVNKGTHIRIGLGKQNQNAKKGRERRGQKKR
jgi:rRNA maturation endonuclease Nob1